MREFENIDIDKVDDVKLIEKEENITKDKDILEENLIVEDKEVKKEKAQLKDFLEEKKAIYQEEDPIYIENDLGRDYYPTELYAGFFRRFFAFILDYLIGSTVATILVDGFLVITGLYPSDKVYSLISTLVVMAYFTVSTYLTNGQSLGKMMLGLKVVSLNGEKLTLPQVLTREFFGRFIHTYSFLFLLYLLTALTERKQNLSDLLADTSVLDLNKERAYKIGQSDTNIYKRAEI